MTAAGAAIPLAAGAAKQHPAGRALGVGPVADPVMSRSAPPENVATS